MNKTKWANDDDFTNAVDQMENAVFVVECYAPSGNRNEIALFSTKERAEAWMERPEFDDLTCVVIPYVIDDPDFGNRKTS